LKRKLRTSTFTFELSTQFV